MNSYNFKYLLEVLKFVLL
uniref:Uncharacterized protein n=1 Tax=Arundo donax TaxID=35708 RepID=A0A0A8YC88_ARUDO